MRLNGEISSGEEEEVIMEKSEVGTTPFLGQKLVVGYALTAKKKKSFLQPNFIALARYFYYLPNQSLFFCFLFFIFLSFHMFHVLLLMFKVAFVVVGFMITHT
jgi:hypothetical protein